MDTRKSSIFSWSYNMKPSPSVLALEELFKSTTDSEVVFENDNNAHFAAFEDDGRRFRDISSPINQDIMNGFSDGDVATMWSHDLTPKSSTITVTSDCQSSIYVGSPASISVTKTQAGDRANSGSSHDESDDDDNGTEAGSYDQGTNPFDIKRIKRKESNRESARRSRRRKQAHLAELEQQVEKLRGESASLFKQHTNSVQQLKDATTNNRVLKSEVEALRAKVKLAEDMVARGSLTSNLSHLLQDYLYINPPQTIQNHHMSSSTISNVHGHGTTTYSSGASFGLENLDPFNNIKNNGVMSDAVSSVSCVSELRPWESHVVSVSK